MASQSSLQSLCVFDEMNIVEDIFIKQLLSELISCYLVSIELLALVKANSLFLWTQFLDLEWWQICFVAVMIFLGFLFTNYIIKKINEARIEEREARLTQREPASQGTQCQELGLKYSVPIKENLPPEENKSLTNRPRKQISLTFDKDDYIHQDHRSQKEVIITKANNAKGLEEIKEVAEKTEDILPCNLSIQHEKHASSSTKIADSLQNKEATGYRGNKQIATQNVEPLVVHNLQISDNPEESLFQKSVDNNCLTHDDLVTQTLEAVRQKLEITEISTRNNELAKKTLEAVREILEKSESSQLADESTINEKEKTENKITTRGSPQYRDLLPETSQSTDNVVLKINNAVLSKEILPQLQKVTLKNTEFLKSETSQLAEETLSQKKSSTSLGKHLTSAKSTTAGENTPMDDSKKNGNHPSTTIGLVMIDVTQKVGYSLFHNTSEFMNENKPKVSNLINNTSLLTETAKTPRQSRTFTLKNSMLKTKCSKRKNSTLAKYVMDITSADTDPQSSHMKKKTKTITHTLNETLKAKYTRNLKSFWDIFLSPRRT